MASSETQLEAPGGNGEVADPLVIGGATVKAEKKKKTASIPPIQIVSASITVAGISPLIVNKFSEKAKEQMRSKQQGRAMAARERKDPDEHFRQSLYVVPGREDWDDGTPGKYYFPGGSFKQCACAAPRFLKGSGITLTAARGMFFVEKDPSVEWPSGEMGGPLLDFGSLSMREDPVRNATGVADLRYRGQFDDWGATVIVSYNERVVNLEQIVNLFSYGGYHVGIGEWRPGSGSGGEYGRFQVISAEAMS